MKKITRQAAFEAKLKFFYTGEPCRKGHLTRRYVSTGSCVECQNKHSAKNRKTADPSLATFEAQVHREDLEKLTAFANALRIGRGLAPLGVVAAAPFLRRITPAEIQTARARAFGHLEAPQDGSQPSPWTGGALK